MIDENTLASSNTNLKVVKTEIKASGESVQIIRPMNSAGKTTDQIIGELVTRFDYKTNDVQATESELNTVHQAFGSNLAEELIKTYEGSNLVSDSQQDLIGEKYLAEQIKLIEEQQKKSSILDKWSHLLYEGEKESAAVTNSYQHQNRTQLDEDENEEEEDDETAAAVATSTAVADGEDEHQQQQHDDDEEEGEVIELHDQTRTSTSQMPTNMESGGSMRASNGDVDVDGGASSSQYNMMQSSQPPPLSQLRSSHSGNLVTSNSQHGMAASQRDLQSRLTQNSHSQSQAEAQFQAQAEAIARAEAEQRAQYAQAQANAQAQVNAQAKAQAQQQQQQQQQKSMSQSHSQINHQETFRRSASQQAQGGSARGSVQQPQPYLPQLSSSNLNSVTLDAYNSPQFKAMLDQLTKPINIPPENINYPPEWPTQDKINFLCEPIYIPAPQPIVIPAPNIITLQNNQLDASRLPEGTGKPTVSYYPSLSTEQSHLKDFGIRQLS